MSWSGAPSTSAAGTLSPRAGRSSACAPSAISRPPAAGPGQATGLRSDQTLGLPGPKTAQAYPAPLRRTRDVDAETGKRFVFLPTPFTLPAVSIAQRSKCRWQVALCFKGINQSLRIQAFYGTSANAVKS